MVITNLSGNELFVKDGILQMKSQESENEKSEIISPVNFTSNSTIQKQEIIEEITNQQSVDEMLSLAVSNNDITPDMATELKKTYDGRPEQLNPILEELAVLRIKYLMSLPWDKLDNSDMGEELHSKFFLGWQFKKYIEYGNTGLQKSDPKYIDIKQLIEWAVNNGGMFEERAKLIKQFPENFDLAKIKEEVMEWMNNVLAEYESMSWDELDECGKLEELKENYFDLYKKKYQENFGIPYIDNSKK